MVPNTNISRKDHVRQQPSQPNTLDIARYNKTMYRALWVQFATVVLYVPLQVTMSVVAITLGKTF